MTFCTRRILEKQQLSKKKTQKKSKIGEAGGRPAVGTYKQQESLCLCVWLGQCAQVFVFSTGIYSPNKIHAEALCVTEDTGARLWLKGQEALNPACSIYASSLSPSKEIVLL